MKTSEKIRVAIKYIEDHGWCQGPFKNRQGNVCLAGSFMETVSLTYEDVWAPIAATIRQNPEAMTAYRSCFNGAFENDDVIICVWFSDRYATCVEDVTSVMEKTAIELEGQGR